ncbi:MAG: histidine ammonia-lyase, partial [Candidatus Zixiibacteriota bacterium]
YGITTGFASLRDRRIDSSDAGKLSANLIRSHAVGVGEPFPEDVVRAAIVVRAQALSLGYSGVRVEFIEALLQLLNERIYPSVPQQGSVGSSGDLAPLSHLFLTVIGDPQARVHRRHARGVADEGAHLRRSGGEYVADARAGDFVPLAELGYNSLPFNPLRLEAKEGLAANNGAVFAAVVAALAVYDAGNIVSSSELIASLSFEALQAVPDCLDEAITASRPHRGHISSANNIRKALEGSATVCASRAQGLSGFNMAHYNRTLLALKELLNTAQTAGLSEFDCDVIGELHAFMSEYQGSVQDALARARDASARPGVKSAKERELALSEVVFSPIREKWSVALHPEAGSEDTARLSAAGFEALSGIYHDHVSRVVRPSANPDVQDNYSFRATPTVLGAARDAIDNARSVIETEINSATDNPLTLLDKILEHFENHRSVAQVKTSDTAGTAPSPPTGKAQNPSPSLDEFRSWLDTSWSLAADHVKSAANFHGQPIGLASEWVSQALAEVGNIAERRIATLMDKNHSKGLPSYLVWNPGLNSGLMMIQYTAASLVTENKTRLFPAVGDSVPTGEGAEDHNSMATTSARNTAEIVKNVESIVALEALAAYQGVQFRKPAKLGAQTGALERMIAGELQALIWQLSGWSGLTEFREALQKLGLSSFAVEDIQTCVVDDVTTYPIIETLTEVVRQGKVSSLASQRPNA